MTTIRKDPDSGEIKAIINGERRARWAAMLRLVQPYLVVFITAIIIPLSLWLVRAELTHREQESLNARQEKTNAIFATFMIEGDRATQQELDTAIAALESKLLVLGILPDAERRMNSLELSVAEINKDVKSNSLSLTSLSTKIDLLLGRK